MELVILGCGTSTGVPTLGCGCPICRSGKPRNTRLRTSAALRHDSGDLLLIDTGPDLRAQALAHDITRVHAVLYTHTHADHLHGIDELRMVNYITQRRVPLYGLPEHLDAIRQRFSYIFEETAQRGGGKPQLTLNPVRPYVPFDLLGWRVTPVPVWHGILPCLAWRIGDIGYMTDLKTLDDSARRAMRGLKVLVLDALRERAHSTHLTLSEAVALARDLGAERTLLTHMNHEVDYDAWLAKLPDGIEPAYDGLTITLPDPR